MFPILVETPWIDIHTYGLLLAAAFGAGIFLAGALARAEGLPPERFTDLGLVALVAGIVGGRLMYVAVEFDQFADRPLDILLRRDGFVYYGGLILGAAAVAVAIRRWGLPLWRSADLLAPCVALGQAIGRLGCWAEGCCFGAPTDLPWGVTFPIGSHVHAAHVAAGLVGRGEHPLPVHPTQIYEAAGAFVLFGLLMALRGRPRPPRFDGAVFAGYLGGYGLLRLLIEFLRGDDRGVSILGASPGQATSIVAIAAGLSLWRLLRPRPAGS